MDVLWAHWYNGRAEGQVKQWNGLRLEKDVPNTDYMGVEPKIRGNTPKWMVKIMENPIQDGMIWGVFPLFLVKHPYPIWVMPNRDFAKLVGLWSLRQTLTWHQDFPKAFLVSGCGQGEKRDGASNHGGIVNGGILIWVFPKIGVLPNHPF